MTGVRISSNAAEVAVLLHGLPPQIDAAVGVTTAHYTQLLRTRVRGRASGRPGPRRVTGDYRRNISGHSGQLLPGVWQGVVGTNSPQSRRLELGFVGRDSLGRTYHQPPYPHFGPALDETVTDYVAALVELVDRVGRNDIGAVQVSGSRFVGGD